MGPSAKTDPGKHFGTWLVYLFTPEDSGWNHPSDKDMQTLGAQAKKGRGHVFCMAGLVKASFWIGTAISFSLLLGQLR